MMASRVHRASHSSMLGAGREQVRAERTGLHHPPAPPQPLGISCLWEVRTTALPSLMMPMMVFHSMRRAWGSMPVVGSSCREAEGRGPGWEPASPSSCTLLGCTFLSLINIALWQTVHKVTPQWARAGEGSQGHGRQGVNQEHEETSARL